MNRVVTNERLRGCRRCRTDERAVSDVIANILLVGVTVIVASGFALLITQLPPPPPTGSTILESFVFPTAPDRLVIEHRGGLSLPLSTLEVVVQVGTGTTRYNVGQRLAAADPAWAVVASDGTSRTSTASLRVGDQIQFTSASLVGATVKTLIVDAARKVVVQDTAPVRDSDSTGPTIASARTSSTTTVAVTMSEVMRSVTSADFTVSGVTVTGARILGTGLVIELVTTAFSTSATPTVSTIASPTGTRDLANNLVQGSLGVAATDGAPPTISALTAGASSSQLWINFTTSETATPTIYFGPTTVYGLTATGSSGTSHSVVLTSLTGGTTYHYLVKATDAGSNTQSGEADRNAGTSGSSGGSGGGGGGGSTAPNYLEWTTVPTTADPGIATSKITVTLRNSAGAAVNPSAALTINLETNSTIGQFLDDSTGARITSISMGTGASTVAFKYVDYRTWGPSVLTASAANTVPGTSVVSVARRGYVAPSGDSVGSLQARLVFTPAQDRAETTALIGLSILNPTPTARTIDSVTITSSPALGTGTSSFFRTTLAVGAGADAEFACTTGGGTLTGADSNAITCNPTDFSLPAWSLKQVTFSFQTSNFGSDGSTALTATVTLASGAGTVTSPSITVRHEGTNGGATMVLVAPATGSGGNRRAAFGTATAGAATDFYLAWNFIQTGGSSHTRFVIPPGWSSVSIPTGQSSLAQIAVSVKQPTATDEGYVDIGMEGPSDGTARDLAIRATPPSMTGCDYFRVEFDSMGSDVDDNVVYGTYDVGVRVA